MNETSCGGISNDTVRRSTLTMLSVHGMMQNKPVNSVRIYAIRK